MGNSTTSLGFAGVSQCQLSLYHPFEITYSGATETCALAFLNSTEQQPEQKSDTEQCLIDYSVLGNDSNGNITFVERPLFEASGEVSATLVKGIATSTIEMTSSLIDKVQYAAGKVFGFIKHIFSGSRSSIFAEAKKIEKDGIVSLTFQNTQEKCMPCMPDNLLHFPSKSFIHAYLTKHHLTKDISLDVLNFVSKIFGESTIEQSDREIQKLEIEWYLQANYNSCCSAERPLGEYMINLHDPEFLKPDFRLICSNKGVIPYKLIPNITEALMDCAEGK